MAMTTPILAATALAGANIALLAFLSFVWLRNYRRFQSGFVLGLAAFGLVMLVENATAIYFFFSMQMLYSGDPGVQTAVLLLRSLQFVALSFLTYVTAK